VTILPSFSFYKQSFDGPSYKWTPKDSMCSTSSYQGELQLQVQSMWRSFVGFQHGVFWFQKFVVNLHWKSSKFVLHRSGNADYFGCMLLHENYDVFQIISSLMRMRPTSWLILLWFWYERVAREYCFFQLCFEWLCWMWTWLDVGLALNTYYIM